MLQKTSENQSNKRVARGREGKADAVAPEATASERPNDLSLDLNSGSEMESGIVAYKASFSVDDKGNAIIIILDRKGEVLKQIPSEEFLNAANALKESFGNILDVEA